MNYLPEPITRVERYLARIAGNTDVSIPEKPITRKEHYLAAWAEKSTFQDVTVTGNPAMLDNATGKPFKDLHIYGRSEQVTTTGAQLFVSKKTRESNFGVTLTQKDDGGWHLEGTNTADDSRNIRLLEPTEYFTLPSGDYTLSFTGDIPNSVTLNIAKVANVHKKDEKWTFLGSINKNKKNLAISLDGTEEALSMYVIFPAQVALSFDFYVMLNAGSSALPWEPYTGGKPSPSPEYPQEIVSAGKDGNLNVTVRGKNIFPGPEQPKTVEKNGLTFSYKDGVYTLTGTTTKNTWFNIYPNIKNSTSVAYIGGTIRSIGKVAVVNGLKNKSCNIAFRIVNAENESVNVTSSDSKKTFEVDANGAFFYAPPGTYSETFTLMIVDENQTEDYEPYHEPQSMSVTTPNGLPGIPVTSGGNYTDENGQQWVCDEVDLEKGVKIQNITSAQVNTKNGKIDEPYRLVFGVPVTGGTGDLECFISVTTFSSWTSCVMGNGFYLKNVPKTDGSFYTAEELKDLALDVDIVYKLATPIETPLTASEIAAYKSLRTYKGTTIVEAEDKAGISVTYTKFKERSI